MTEFSKIIARLSFKGNELISKINKFAKFNVMLQNNSSNPLSKITINLSGPSVIKIPIKKKKIGFLAPSKERNIDFQVKPTSQGLFDLMITIMEKETISATLPFKLRAVTHFQRYQIKFCPKCGFDLATQRTESDFEYKKCHKCTNFQPINAIYCTVCGVKQLIKTEEFSQNEVYCPSCGSAQKFGAKYCANCGKEIAI